MNDSLKCNKNKSGSTGVAKNPPKTEPRNSSSLPSSPVKSSAAKLQTAKDTPKKPKMSMSWPLNKPLNTTTFCSQGFTPSFNKNIRYWEKIEMKSSIGPLNSVNSVSYIIMSYNILAQVLLENHSYLYSFSSTESLKWNNRFKKIVKEIVTMNPDILCLQEVQSTHLESISMNLKQLGFKYVYKKRTGIRIDGCAIFYKEKLFNLLDYQSIEFFQPGVNILNRDNIGLMVKLAPKSLPDTPFVVCTTHLLYNPKRTDVRLAQVRTFFGEIDKFSFHKVDGEAKYYPIILTGDFNSQPDNPVNEFIVSGKIKSDESYVLPLREIGLTDSSHHLSVYLERNNTDSSEMRNLSLLYHSEFNENQTHREKQLEASNSTEFNHLFTDEIISHRLNFQSVYPHIKNNSEKEATSFQDEWVTVDYIYYSSNSAGGNLHLLERFRLPTASECCNLNHLPNQLLGSDHLSLTAKFILVKVLPVSKV